ncbi:transposase [Scytonema sp. NUACC26]|uniref:helix-turn-helix domain-containing protein n=1 Tax=Scytonema sp. NUACC26 TaxID=3140176 RepID=UPI0034DCB5EB
MKTYNQDLRQKIIDAYLNREGSDRQLAANFRVSLSFIQTLVGRFLDTGSIAAFPHKSGNPPKLQAENLEVLKQLVAENNDATLEELCVQMELKTQIKVSRATMGKTLQKLGLTRKKNLTRSGTRYGKGSKTQTRVLGNYPYIQPG